MNLYQIKELISVEERESSESPLINLALPFRNYFPSSRFDSTLILHILRILEVVRREKSDPLRQPYEQHWVHKCFQRKFYIWFWSKWKRC